LALNENKYAAVKILAEKGLPVQLADFIVAPDADTTKANIKTVEKIMNDAVAEAVKKQIGYTPGTSGNSKAPLTKEDVMKMSLREQQELYQRNPELYNQIFSK
jgi:hypothetical protein